MAQLLLTFLFWPQTLWPFILCTKQLPYFWASSNSRRSAIELGAPRCHNGSSLVPSLGVCVFSNPALYIMLFMPCWISLLENHHTAPRHLGDDAPFRSTHHWEWLGCRTLPLPFIILMHGIDPHCVESTSAYSSSFIGFFFFGFFHEMWPLKLEVVISREKMHCFAKFKEAESARGRHSDFRLGSELYGSFGFLWHLPRSPDEMVLTSMDPVRAFPFVPEGERWLQTRPWKEARSSRYDFSLKCPFSLILLHFGRASSLISGHIDARQSGTSL